jgi:hypothetical protein
MTFTELTPLIADFSIEINPQEAKASSVELPLIARTCRSRSQAQ